MDKVAFIFGGALTKAQSDAVSSVKGDIVARNADLSDYDLVVTGEGISIEGAIAFSDYKPAKKKQKKKSPAAKPAPISKDGD